MNFGLIESLERALAKPSEKLTELLEGITAEQRRTNELLEQLVAIGSPRPRPVRTAAPKEDPR